jgi:hypothetical protein
MTHAVTFTLGFDDYLATARARAASGMLGRHAHWLRYAVVVALFLATVIGLAIFDGTITDQLRDPQSLGLILGGAILIMLICLLIDFLFERVVYRWSFKRFAMADADLTVTLDAEGMRWSAPSLSGTLGWPRAWRVIATPGCIFLFISKIEVMALPRRAFATEAAFNDAAHYAQAQADAATRTS